MSIFCFRADLSPAGGHFVSASALPDKALEVWSQYEVAVLSLVSTRLGQGDHPELADNALLSLNDRTLQQADHARHLSLSVMVLL